jgi:putative transposase
MGVRAEGALGKIRAMPSTHLSLHYHVVFSTKDRTRIIRPEWIDRLHGYVGGILADLKGVAETVGGVDDHIHVLIGLRATHCLADVVRELKAGSSRWVHSEIGDQLFAWQEGYDAFTVSPTHREAVQHYIARQAEHHLKRSYQEEYLEFLRLGGVEYDERYLW